ncbi:THAP domain-containing protein 1 isoform X3 [Procambarus clarkii]|uniref:THAP domain-containing protein 1 isoform X3 n=1 Tax=Procambarus clarkii TaxID=6728 RepID=UPI001E676F31|nr:THAP domain-containing protein 1-like isoform X1 [Procambarus clarkii]
MPVCAAYGCHNRPDRDRDKSYHKFPWNNRSLFKRWLINLRREKYTPSKQSVVCSDHFEDSQLDRTGQITRLRMNAAPTIFKAFPSHLIKVIKHRKPPKERPSSYKLPESTSSVKISLEATLNFHSYAMTESPRKLKRKLDIALDELAGLKKRLKVSQRHRQRLCHKLNSMTEVIESLRGEQLITENTLNMVC